MIDVFDRLIADAFKVHPTIFQQYQTKYAPEWMTSDDAVLLDALYFENKSSYKFVSPLIAKIMQKHQTLVEDEALTEQEVEHLADLMHLQFSRSWEQYWKGFKAEYNPINNYDMVETETPAEETVTTTPAEMTETRTPAEMTETDTPTQTTVTADNDSGVYPFNASEDTPTPTDTGKTVTKGTVDVAGTHKTEVDTPETVKREVDSAETRKNTVNADRVLTRSGNIGVTTATQMLEEHETFWARFNLVDMLCADVDSILTTYIY